MRLYARASNAKHRPKYSLGIICQWIGGLVNSPLLARSAYGSFVLCSRDESGTASRTKPFIANSWRCFSELCSVLDTTSIGVMHRIGVETSYLSENVPLLVRLLRDDVFGRDAVAEAFDVVQSGNENTMLKAYLLQSLHDGDTEKDIRNIQL